MSTRPGDLLSGICAGAKSLVVAAPYVKANALTRLLTDVSPESSLVCVTRWTPHDLAVGASDIECRTIVTERGGAFRLHPSLHAKYYRIDKVVLIGSANLTSAALGWSQQPNLEILCRPGADFDPCAFQRRLLSGSRAISDEEFAHWRAISEIKTQTDSANGEVPPLLDNWRPTTRNPTHVELVYYGREDAIASFDEQRAAQRDISALRIPPGLNDDEVRAWLSACLLATPFANTVLEVHNTVDLVSSYRQLATTYGLNITDARRSMETVQNWLALLTPEILSGSD